MNMTVFACDTIRNSERSARADAREKEASGEYDDVRVYSVTTARVRF